MAEGLRRARETRPPTHQGPRPRLGMVAGVMMPLTSCWMILERQAQAAVSAPNWGRPTAHRDHGPSSSSDSTERLRFQTRGQRDPEQGLSPEF